MNRRTITIYILLGLSALVYMILGYVTPRTDFIQTLLLYAFNFAAYLYIINQRFSIWIGIGTAIFFRLLLLFAIPALSDDYFRFIWDGRLLAAGINPYLHLPSSFMADAATSIPGITESLYLQLNSPSYFSVYPPVAQGIFWLSTVLSPDNLTGSIVVIRVFIILTETGSIILLLRLMRKMAQPDRNVLLYALNPLVILELTGNLHIEALMIFFILLSAYLILNQRIVLAGGIFGLAIGTKLLPLLFLPIVWRRLGLKQFIIFGASLLLACLVIFYPLLTQEALTHIFQSINLYFQRFEFNASIYYVLRWLGFRLTGYNQVAFLGPFLSVATLVIVVAIAIFKKPGTTKRMLGFMAVALTVYLFLATTVHPWYITTLVALTAVSHFRFAVVWSGLVILSYAAYSSTSYTEDLALIILEYSIVFLWVITELYMYRQRLKLANLN